jgi:phage pi2 protein 07
MEKRNKKKMRIREIIEWKGVEWRKKKKRKILETLEEILFQPRMVLR